MKINILKSHTSTIVVTFLIVSLFAFALVPLVTNAAPASSCKVRANVTSTEATDLLGFPSGGALAGSDLGLTGAEAGDNALLCTYGLIKFVTNLLFVIVLVIATLFIALAAFYFLTAGAKPDKVEKARNFLIFAIVGLVVASVAKVVPAIVRGFIGL